MTLYVATVDAGAAGPGLHVHEFDQFYYVLEGTMSIEIGLASCTAGPHTLVVLRRACPTASGTTDRRASATSR